MKRPSPAILGSVALHAAVVALAFVSWPRKDMPTPMAASVPVSIVSDIEIAAAPADNPSSEEVTDDAATAPPPPIDTPPEVTPPEPTPAPKPSPPRPAPTPQPTPPPKTRPTPPRPTPPRPSPPRRQEPSLDLDALAGPSHQTPNHGRPATGQQGQGRAPQATGPQLSALARQVVPNWNVNAVCDLPGGDALVIRVRVNMAADGRVLGTPRIEDSRNDPAWRAAADSMLRALRATSPFDVPDGFSAQEVPFRFETAKVCGNR